MPRPQLYRRIEVRTRSMFAAGLLQEVEQFAAGKERGIGYAEARAVRQKRLGLEEAIAKVAQATRHYAKRQLTWFGRDPEVVWLDSQPARWGETLHQAEQLLVEFLGNLFVGLR